MTVPPRKKGNAIGIIGCTGRMGRLLIDELQSDAWADHAILSGGSVRAGSISKQPPANFFVTDDADALLQTSSAVIDFTTPESTAKTVWLAAKRGIAYVTGTTGLNAAQEQELQDAAREIPIVYAANMSVGVTLLSALVEQAAARLGPDWDIEILETHHRHKVDAPSGTALMLGRSAAKGRDVTLDDQADWARHGQTGGRDSGHIGFAVRRGGDVIGEHTVGFYSEGERIELSHTATDRRLFARGAIRAALWALHQKPGLYSMRDVLGL